MVLSDNQSRWGKNDPQISMLLKLDKKYVPILLDAFGKHGNSRHNHLILVLNVMVDESHKKIIFDTFKEKIDLIHVIIDKGWVEYVMDVIANTLNRAC